MADWCVYRNPLIPSHNRTAVMDKCQHEWDIIDASCICLCSICGKREMATVIIEQLQEVMYAAQEVIDDNWHPMTARPGPYDCLGINGRKLWALKQTLLKVGK